MKLRTTLAALAFIGALFSGLFAQDAAPAPSPAAADLQALVKKISAKIRGGERTEAALAPELAEFDALLAKYPDKNDDSAQIALMKAMLYVQVFGNEDKGKELLTEVTTKYAGTRTAQGAERMLFQMSPEGKAQAAAEEKAREAKLAALVGQPAPELNFTWASKDGLQKLSDLKGQVVVLDFWATWCGPCIASFPQVRKEVEHFKGSPVTFLGVTSLQGRVMNLESKPINTKDDPQKEYELMPAFMKKHDMTWDVAFSSQNVFNEDYGIQGIPYVAIIAPDGKVRHVGLHPGNPASDIQGKITELLKEFNLAAPKA